MTRMIEPASSDEARRLRQVLEHFANALAQKLIAQGISRKLLVKVIEDVVKEMFGEQAKAIDLKAMLGETEPAVEEP